MRGLPPLHLHHASRDRLLCRGNPRREELKSVRLELGVGRYAAHESTGESTKRRQDGGATKPRAPIEKRPQPLASCSGQEFAPTGRSYETVTVRMNVLLAFAARLRLNAALKAAALRLRLEPRLRCVLSCQAQ